MPEGASDGAFSHGATFILGPPRFFYEYTISEEGFRSEMKRRGLEVTEILGEKFVPRYLMNHIRSVHFAVLISLGSLLILTIFLVYIKSLNENHEGGL